MWGRIKTFLFRNTGARQTVAKNTFWLFFGEIGSRLLRGAIVIYAARILGAEGWGIFSYAINLAAFFTVLSDVGLSAMLTREAAKSPELRAQYLSTSLFLKLILTFLCVLIIIFAAPFFTKIAAAKPLLPIVAFILIFDGLREFGFSLNRAMEQMEWEAIIKIFTNFAIVVLGFVFLLVVPSSRSLAVSYTLGSAAGFAAVIWVLRSYFRNLFANFSRKFLWPIFASAWPFALSGLLGGIMLNIDTILLGWWRTAAEIGFYSSAQRPIQLLYIFPSLFAGAVFPIFARLAKKNNEKFREIMEMAISAVFLLCIPLALGGIILGKDIIYLLFGSEYLKGVTTFKIFLTTLLVVSPSTIVSYAVFAYDEQKKFVNFLLIGAVGNVVFDIILIPPFGIEGSAVATVIAQLLANGYVWLAMKKVNYFSVLPRLRKVLVAAFVMGGTTIFFQLTGVNFLINIALSAAVYLGILKTQKEPLLGEIKAMLKA